MCIQTHYIETCNHITEIWFTTHYIDTCTILTLFIVYEFVSGTWHCIVHVHDIVLYMYMTLYCTCTVHCIVHVLYIVLYMYCTLYCTCTVHYVHVLYIMYMYGILCVHLHCTLPVHDKYTTCIILFPCKFLYIYMYCFFTVCALVIRLHFHSQFIWFMLDMSAIGMSAIDCVSICYDVWPDCIQVFWYFETCL
jgi:hypothetical protein